MSRTDSESGGAIPIDVVLGGETGQTLSEAITVSLLDLLSGTAVAGTDYALPANAEVAPRPLDEAIATGRRAVDDHVPSTSYL